jgi:riboflavin kinase/FMN adenylyltransferase
MSVFDFSLPLDKKFHGSVAAIGNFDAVHRGHQALLEVGRKRALHLGAPFSVLTFEPHPRALFTKGNSENFRVTPDIMKQDLLFKYGVDIIFSLPFTNETAKFSADHFISFILKDTLKLQSIVCGYDFHFGHNRTGNINHLEKAGLNVIELGALKDMDDDIYSATRIREYIKKGDIQSANALLGWDWFIRGTVSHGDKRGRTIGFPTLNIPMGDTIVPRMGVYASLTRHKSVLYNSISNIGVRPTFATPTPMVETHIFNFDQDIYNDDVEILPIHFIRDEVKFSSLDELKTQIEIDCKAAQAVFVGYHA